METTSVPTAAHLKEAAEQLARERRRRLTAEDASKKVQARLAEERTVAAELRQGMQHAQAALADIRQEKDQAVRAPKSSNELLQEQRLTRDRAEAEVAAAKGQVVEMEAKLAKTVESEARLAKIQQDALMDKKELQETRAALLAAKRQNEELLARFEPAPSGARQLR
jgi:chromosome segregation ATPase